MSSDDAYNRYWYKSMPSVDITTGDWVHIAIALSFHDDVAAVYMNGCAVDTIAAVNRPEVIDEASLSRLHFRIGTNPRTDKELTKVDNTHLPKIFYVKKMPAENSTQMPSFLHRKFHF